MPWRAACCAVHRNIQIGLAEDAEEAEIFYAGDAAHYVYDFIAFFFEDLQIVAVEFDGQLAFYAADGFFHVVRDRLRKIPEDAGHFAQLGVHRGDQLVFIFVENGAPLVFGFQVHEIFGVEEASGVCAVVGAADLAGYFRDFGKGSEDVAGLIGDADAFGGAGAGGQGAADPDGAFIEVGEKFGADHAAES